MKANGRHGLTVGAAVGSGLQAVVILVISQRALTLDEFAPLTQLWAIWAVSAASMNYGFQQWAALHPAGLGVLTTDVGRSLRSALLVVCLLLFVATTILRHDLFSSSDMVWPFFAGLLPLGTAAVGLNRGELARTGHTKWLALAIGTENTLRLGATILLALLDAPAPLYGVALMLGFLVAFLPKPTRQYDRTLELEPLGAAVGAGLMSHALLFGAPLILALGGGDSDDVVRFFLILSAVRAPFVLLQGLVPQIAVRFGQHDHSSASTVRVLIATGVAGAALAFGTGLVVGDPIVGRVFDIRGEVAGGVYGLIGAAAMLSVALSIVNVQLVAIRRIRPLVTAWALPVAGTLVALISGILDSLGTVVGWTFGCHALVAVVLTVLASAQSTSVAGSNPVSR